MQVILGRDTEILSVTKDLPVVREASKQAQYSRVLGSLIKSTRDYVGQKMRCIAIAVKTYFVEWKEW